MPEGVTVCPFNKEHIIQTKNLQKHIIKCMVNYPDHETCPYNALHRFLEKEKYVEHIFRCPDKPVSVLFTNRPYQGGDVRKQNIHIDNIRSFNLQEENWDED